MATVKKGDRIRIYYVGKFEDGTAFDSTEKGPPVEIIVGKGAFLKDLEAGVIGMSPGETRTIRMEQPYGPVDKEKMIAFDRDKIPSNFALAVGRQIQMHRADGKMVTVTVAGISGQSVMLDRNHPLAGKDLIYDIRLEEIL